MEGFFISALRRCSFVHRTPISGRVSSVAGTAIARALSPPGETGPQHGKWVLTRRPSILGRIEKSPRQLASLTSAHGLTGSPFNLSLIRICVQQRQRIVALRRTKHLVDVLRSQSSLSIDSPNFRHAWRIAKCAGATFHGNQRPERDTYGIPTAIRSGGAFETISHRGWRRYAATLSGRSRAGARRQASRASGAMLCF